MDEDDQKHISLRGAVKPLSAWNVSCPFQKRCTDTALWLHKPDASVRTNINFIVKKVGFVCPLQIGILVLVLNIFPIICGFPKNIRSRTLESQHFVVLMLVGVGGSDRTLRNSALESCIPLDFQSTVCNLVSKALESVYKHKFSAFFEIWILVSTFSLPLNVFSLQIFTSFALFH